MNTRFNQYRQHRPLKAYQTAISSGKLLPNETQKTVMLTLDKIYKTLYLSQKNSYKLYDYFCHIFKKNKANLNLYLWGSVGSGKTSLMDLFFNSLSSSGILKKKQQWRVHFHDFMQTVYVHLKQYQGKSNPLAKIAKFYAKTQGLKLICLDEFIVDNIADAMILRNLYQAFFNQQIIIITTSNTAPDELYPNGLQRDLFLPAIKLIKQKMIILELSHAQDYRLSAKKPVKQQPLTVMTMKTIKTIFEKLASGKIYYNNTMIIHNREIAVIANSNNVIWLDCQIICNIPRNASDYIALAKKYKIIILDHINMIDENQKNMAECFVKLIDVLYDAKIILFLNTCIPVNKILLGNDFTRTNSRLIAMKIQADDFLSLSTTKPKD